MKLQSSFNSSIRVIAFLSLALASLFNAGCKSVSTSSSAKEPELLRLDSPIDYADNDA
jgi:hypothetical protein